MSSSSAANKSENILSQLGSPEAEPYVMNGTRGFCYACNLELTSLQHCNQHITGSKHLKKVKEETKSTSFYNTDSNSVSGLGLSPNTEMFVPQASAPQFSINHLQNSVLHHPPFLATSEQSRLLSSSVANYSENILSQLGSPNAELYVMNGTRGFCYACNLELTSLQHCNQHITGSKHLKKVKETSTSFYNCNTNFTSGLGQGLATSANLQPFPPDRSQQAAPHQSPFSTSGQPMTRNPLSSIMPLKGPNGEAYVMNGTRGFCYVCGLELTSPEHAQSHLSGTKHKKKSGADTLSSMDTSLTNGKILMCSLCQVPFSCIKNAEEHFRSDKHKKKVANLPKDYSNDPEQTQVMKPYTTPGPKSSDDGDCKDQSNFVSSGHDSSAGLISPVEFTEILDKAKENKNTNSAPVEVVTKGENKFNNVHSSAASVLVTDKQGMTTALNSHKDGSLDRVIIGPEQLEVGSLRNTETTDLRLSPIKDGLDRVIIGPEQLEVGSLRNTEMTDVRLSPIKDGLDKQQVELGAPPSVSPKNVNTKDNDNNLNASFHEVLKLKNKDVPTEERQACSELNSLTKDGQTLQSSIIDNAKQTGYMGSVSQSKSTVTQQLSAPVDFQESEQQMATSKNDHFVPASMDYLQHSHSQEDLQEFRDMNPSLTYHHAIDPAATQQLSVPLNSTQIKQQLATSDNGTSASMAYHQHSSFEELSQDLNVINPSLTNYNAIDSSVTQQLSAPFNSTQSKQQLATSHNITSASVDHLQHSNSQQFSQDIHVMNPSLLEHISIDPEMQRTAHSQLPFHSNLQQSACPEHKSPTPNLLISQSTVPNEGMQHLQDDSRTEINENLKGYFSSSAVNSAQRSAIDKQPIKVQTQGHPQRVLYFSPSQDDIDKQQRIDKKATVACQSSHLKNINDKENKEKNFQNIEAHSKDVDIYVRTEAFPMTNKADVTSVEGAGHSASKEQHLRFMQQLPKAASNTEMNQTRLEENRNQIRQHLPESVSNAEMSQTRFEGNHNQIRQHLPESVSNTEMNLTRFVENRNQLMQQLPESVSNTEMNQTKFEGNRNQLTQQLPESVSNIPVNQMNSQKDHSNSESLAQQVTDTISHTPQQVTDTISHTPQQFTGTISHTPFNQVTFPGQQRQPFDCTQHLQESFSNLQINQFGSELPSSSESEEQYYYFNGSKGFCHACSIELTSFQHTNQHINGQKHQKKVQQMHFTTFLQKESKSPMAVTSDNLVSGVQSFPPLPQENCFMFDGNRGMCHVCQIELTSLQHATQHLNGKGHKRNVERRNLEKKGITYPLFCEVCNKSFTGTESAVQHFTSSKHKSKAQLLEINPFRDRKGDSVIIKDGLTWFICDVCQCRVNTREQLMKHKETLKHKELEDTLSRGETTQTPINLNVISVTPSELNGRYNDTRQEHILDSGNILQNSMYGETPKIVRVDAARQKHILADNQQHLTYGETPRICLDTSSPIALKYTSSLKSQKGVSLNQNRSFNGSQPIGCPILGLAANVSAKPANLQNLVVTQVALETNASNKESPNLSFGFMPNLANSESGAQRSQNESGTTFGFMPNLANSRESGAQRSQIESGTTFGFMPNLANSRESGAQRNQNESETTIGRTGIIEKRCNSVVEQFKNLRIGAVGGGPSRGCSQNDTSAADSDDDQSVSRHRLDFSSSEYMTKPGKPRHSNSRGGDKGKISLDRQESERESDEDDLLEDRKNFNIQEEIVQSETPVTVVEKPDRSTKHGFKYHCKTCDKHMNTRANFDAHIAGASHLYISSLQKVPPRQLDPIRKTNFSFNVHYKDILVHAFNCTIQVPRAYQMELLHKTMMGDYIVYLPTGTGKTLVAVLTMALMLDENPSRPVLFLVDKVLLVLQQTKYIKSQLHEKKINRLNDDKQIVKQEVTIKAICGGVISKTARPIWNYDIVVTTAAFCQNMLERDLIRWEDFSLVVLDEVHHCNKLHPYFKLLDKYHNILPAISRPKILGLTASPAGKSSIQETYDMLQGLLKNLGGAKIAIVEEEDEELKSLQSTAEIHPVCVPLSSKEREFRTALLEYIVLCYSKLAHLSNLRTVTTPPCSYLTDAVNHPGDRQISMRIAKRFLVDEEPLSDLIGVINSANPLRETDSQKFGHLKLHLMQIMLSLSEVGTGADFISELDAALSPSKNVEAFQGLGLPFRDMHELVLNFAADGNKDLTMFSKLIETLKDKTFIDWSNRLSKALILVRERKLARQLTKKLRDDPLITDNNLSVQYLVGHGGGAQSHGMDVKKQKRVLDNQEKYNIFVATSIMEEGIDFQLLEMVISMNPPTSLRALVQIRGRARKKGSHFVILCSSEEEVEKLNKLQQAEKNMQAAAKHCIEKDRLRSISATRSA